MGITTLIAIAASQLAGYTVFPLLFISPCGKEMLTVTPEWAKKENGWFRI
jgi:hypothetical protein